MSLKWMWLLWMLSVPAFSNENEARENPKTVSDCVAAVFDADNAKIQSRVDDEFRRRGVDPTKVPKVKENHLICLNVPASEGLCLPAGSSWWRMRSQAKLLYQATQAANFVADYHVGVGGRKDVLFGFKEVIFVPPSELPHLVSMKLANDKLYVGFPGTLEYAPYSALQLRNLWDKGAMFPPFTTARKRWRYMNPVGFFRSGVRKSMKSAAVLAQKKIAELIDKVEAQPTEVIAAVESMVDVASIEPILVEKLRRATPERLRRILLLMSQELNDEDTSESMVEAAIVAALSEPAARNYIVTMVGALNIGNFHDIGIKIRVGLLKYVKITDNAPKTIVTLVAPINIFTIDDVKVSIDFNRAHETAALESSLAAP